MDSEIIIIIGKIAEIPTYSYEYSLHQGAFLERGGFPLDVVSSVVGPVRRQASLLLLLLFYGGGILRGKLTGLDDNPYCVLLLLLGLRNLGGLASSYSSDMGK